MPQNSSLPGHVARGLQLRLLALLWKHSFRLLHEGQLGSVSISQLRSAHTKFLVFVWALVIWKWITPQTETCIQCC